MSQRNYNKSNKLSDDDLDALLNGQTLKKEVVENKEVIDEDPKSGMILKDKEPEKVEEPVKVIDIPKEPVKIEDTQPKTQVRNEVGHSLLPNYKSVWEI